MDKVIMFDDFAREDLPDPRVAALDEAKKAEKERMKKEGSKLDGKDYDPSPYDYLRPSGFDKMSDEDDNDPEWKPDGIKDDSLKVLRDIYIGNEYDSAAKKEARFVVRNITGFSVLIGVIFTIIW